MKKILTLIFIVLAFNNSFGASSKIKLAEFFGYLKQSNDNLFIDLKNIMYKAQESQQQIASFEDNYKTALKKEKRKLESNTNKEIQNLISNAKNLNLDITNKIIALLNLYQSNNIDKINRSIDILENSI